MLRRSEKLDKQQQNKETAISPTLQLNERKASTKTVKKPLKKDLNVSEPYVITSPTALFNNDTCTTENNADAESLKETCKSAKHEKSVKAVNYHILELSKRDMCGIVAAVGVRLEHMHFGFEDYPFSFTLQGQQRLLHSHRKATGFKLTAMVRRRIKYTTITTLFHTRRTSPVNLSFNLPPFAPPEIGPLEATSLNAAPPEVTSPKTVPAEATLPKTALLEVTSPMAVPLEVTSPGAVQLGVTPPKTSLLEITSPKTVVLEVAPPKIPLLEITSPKTVVLEVAPPKAVPPKATPRVSLNSASVLPAPAKHNLAAFVPCADPSSKKPRVVIHEVWANNLVEEFVNIRKLIANYPYVAFDTEFPGVVSTPIGAYQSKDAFLYTQMSTNVNILKVIQIGICLVNRKGELPPTGDIWQFNFKFTLETDMHSLDSINLLSRSGIDFVKTRELGIRLEDFGALLTTSGLIANEKVTWLAFHSYFDYGYLIKSIIIRKLPTEAKDFLYLHKVLFPRSYDLKVLLKAPNIQAVELYGGLQDIADQLKVKRVGAQHQAGSDSLLTAKTFFKLRKIFFRHSWHKVAKAVRGLIFGFKNAKEVSFAGLPLVVPTEFKKSANYLLRPPPERTRDPSRPVKLLSVVNPKTMEDINFYN